MFLVQKSKVGSSTEYLANAEEEHSKNSVAFDSPKMEDFLKKHNIKADGLTPELYSNYLDQQNNHYKAKFIGRLAEEWKLEAYDRNTFNDLMSNKLPKNVVLPDGVKIKKNGNIITTKGNAETGTDTVSNVPKSVSIEFARGNKETKDKIVNALNKTAEQVFTNLEKQVKPKNTDKKYQDFVPGSAKLLITTFVHYENRGYIDENGERRLEPNLHIHGEIKNYAEFSLYKHDKDGNRLKDEKGNFLTEKKMLAIDPEEIFKRQLENSANFDTLLNSNLQKEGYKTEPADEKSQTFRLCGYTKELENSLSTRINEIHKYIEEQKKKGVFYSSEEQAEAEYTKSVRQNTAKTKEFHKADDILENINKTISLNISKEQFDKIDKIQAESKQNTIEPDLLKIAKCQAFETNGVINETVIKAEIYKQVRFSQTFSNAEELENKVNRTFDNLQTIAMGENRIIKMEDGRYTRLDIALNEKALENNVNILTSQDKNLSKEETAKARKFIADLYNDRKQEGFRMNRGQLDSLKLAIKQKPISMCIGDAGTGKTTSFIFGTNALHESLGRKVFGISVGTSTSRDLVDGKVKAENCLNTKEFLMKAYVLDKNTGKPSNKLNMSFVKENLNSTIIFDEAGMCGSEDMRKITDFVKETRNLGGDTQLVLVGDHKQLSAVSYGNAFTNIQKQLDKDSIVRLDENTRQKNDVAKAVAEGYRDKDINKVFTALEENNLLITAKTQDQVNKSLVKDYLNDQSKSKLIVCGTNAEIDNINDMVRTGLILQEFKKPKEQQTIDFDKSVEIEVSRKAGSFTVERERSFCPGEEIVFLQNSSKTQKKAGFEVSNSDRGIIKNITKLEDNNFKLTVDIKGRQVEFETKDYNTINHCYAVSTHKSQGKTVENLYHLGNANQANAQNSYVNGSRHKEQYKLYLAEDQVDRYKLNAVKEAVKETTLNDSNCQKAVEEYVFKKVYEERKELKPMPEFKQKEVNKEEQLNVAMDLSKKLTHSSKLEFNKQYEKKLELEYKVKQEQEKARRLKEQEQKEKLAQQQKLASLTAERMKEFDKSYGHLEPKNIETKAQMIEQEFFTSYKNAFIKNGNALPIDKYESKKQEFIDDKIKKHSEINFLEKEMKGIKLDRDLNLEAYKEVYNSKEKLDVEDVYKNKVSQREEKAKEEALNKEIHKFMLDRELDGKNKPINEETLNETLKLMKEEKENRYSFAETYERIEKAKDMTNEITAKQTQQRRRGLTM